MENLMLTPPPPQYFKAVAAQEIPVYEDDKDQKDELLNTPFIGRRDDDGSYFVDCYQVKEKQVPIYKRLLMDFLTSKGFFIYNIRTYYTDFGNKGHGRLTFDVMLFEF